MMEAASNKNFWVSFSANPVVKSIAIFAGIIAIPLSIYIYYESIQSPDLTFSVNPVKLEVVSTNQSSNLSISFDGKSIDSDITTTQIAIWNQGKAPIKKADILKPIIISINPNRPILEASIRKTSRDVIQFSLNSDELQQGRMSVSWEVLEHNDGGMIEVIYAGSPDVNFNIEGAVIGQKEVTRYENKIGFQSPNEEFEAFRTRNKRIRFMSLPLAAITILGLIFIVIKIIKLRSQPAQWRGKVLVIIAVLLIIMAGLLIAMFSLSRYPTPPHGL